MILFIMMIYVRQRLHRSRCMFCLDMQNSMNETGVNGLFHVVTEGIIYNLIILYINDMPASIENTENTISDFSELFFVITMR